MNTDVQTPKPESTPRPILKWSLIAAACLLALVFVLLLALRFAAQSGFGRNFVEARIEAADPSGQNIEVEGLSGDLLGTFRIERLTVADEDGVWLVAENLLAEWKPLALRKRALLVDALEADLIHVIRRPVLVPSDKPKQDGGSLPLRAGEIDRLRIGEFRSDEGVLPRALSLAIDAQGQVGQDGGRTKVAVIPLEGDGDSLSADLQWSDDFRVSGNLDLDGPAGGLFASLAQLDAGQTLSARLNAGGTLDEWEADSLVSIDSNDAVSLTASSEDDIISFVIEAHPGLHPLTASITDTLGNTLSVEGDLSRDEGRPVLDISAIADGLQLSARATQSGTGAYSADIRLIADNPGRYAKSDSISVGQAILDGNLTYDDAIARFDGSVNARDVDVPSFQARTVSGPLVVLYDSPQISVRTTLTGERAVLPGISGQIAGPAPIVQTNAIYDLSTSVLALNELTVRGRGGRVAGAGNVTTSPALSADFSGSFQLDGAAANLARPIRANGQFQANRSGAGVTRLNTRITATNFGALPAPLDQWAGEQAIVTAKGELRADGSLDLPAFTAETGSLKLNGSGRMSSEQVVSASANLSAGSAAFSGFNLSSLTGTADISGPLDDLQFTTRLNTPSLIRDGFAFENLTIAADGRYADGALDTQASLDGETTEGPVNASTRLSLSGSDWQVQGFKASWSDLVAQADLSGSGGDLGAIRGSADIDGDLPEGLPANAIDLTANIDGEKLVLDATLEDVAFGPTKADALVLRATGTPDNADFVVDMDGWTDLNGLSQKTGLDIDGNIKGLTTGGLDLTASLSALLGEVGLTTEAPVRYTQYEDGFEASARFAALGGSFSPQITTRGPTSISLKGQNLRIAPLLTLAGRPALEGALNIDAELVEAEGGLSGPIRADLKSIARSGSELPPIDLFVSADLQPDLLDVNVRALDNDALEANVDLEVPVTTSPAPPFLSVVSGANMPFSATADGQIEAIAALLVPPQMVMKGLIDLNLSGVLPTLDNSFSGNFRFSEGEFEHGDLGLVMHSIEADAGLGNGTVTLRRFNAEGRSGGTLTGSGTMAIDGSAMSDLELKANSLVVTERREGSATVSGAMKLVQQPDLLEVTGDLTVDEGVINIDKLPDGGPATLDVSFEEPEEEVEDAEEAATRLNINLNAPGRIDIRGRGVNAELGLDAEITGTMGSPVITGEARIVRGRFDLIGKRFQFAESSVRLEPEISSSPLSVTARHETNDDITAILEVTGTIERPEIALTSEPVLPEDEVLSRVLFGRSPTQLTALETARLAAALAQLSGGGGFDLLGGIEQSLGLDTFDVGSGSTGNVEVTSGKYLTENVYLEVRSGAAGAPGVAIEWEPLSNIEVEAATSTEEGNQLSVQWKRDFND